VALRHAILEALIDREASGYELAKDFDPSANYFWHCASGQLYSELARLEEAGLTDGHEIVQDRRPNKRVFTLTEDGRRELTEFIAAPTRPSFLRDDLLVKVRAAGAEDAETILEQLEQRAAVARSRIAEFDKILPELRGGLSEQEYLADVPRVGPYLSCVRGRAFEQENLDWCTWAADVVRARQHVRPLPHTPRSGDAE
jgi:DNA-binding PadR family transcriptional regulator